MKKQKIVSETKWLMERKKLLRKEKAFTRQRDSLSRQRQNLPWVEVKKKYLFRGSKGKETLSMLFQGKSQLVIYHFMFGPGWKEGCPSCSFWADNFGNIPVHLAHRDVSMLAVSRAPLTQINRFKKRMGWKFKWVSSFNSEFNSDYQVSFNAADLKRNKVYYNYIQTSFPAEEGPGISVFAKYKGKIYHTYSTYARGLDMLNGAYHYLDLVPKGRDEDKLPWTMAWLRHHDKYGKKR